MKLAFREIRQAWRLLSRRGHLTLISYGLSLTVLSGLDSWALVLVSRLFTGFNSSPSTDLSALVLIVVLFVTRTAVSTLSSWWVVQQLADEELNIGTRNLMSLMNEDHFVHDSEADYHNAVDRGPSNVAQGLAMYSVTIASEAATSFVILGTLLVLDPLTAISSTVYFLLVAVLQNKGLSIAAARAGSTVANQTAAVYEILTDGFNLRKLLKVMPSESYNPSVYYQRKLLAFSRARVAFLATLPRYTMELVLSVGLMVVCGVSYIFAGDEGVVKSLAIFGVAGFRLLPSINRIQGMVLMMFSALPMARLALIANPQLKSVANRPISADSYEVVSFDHVSYSYPKTSTESLVDVSMSFNRGLQYAIVGPSGAGKTTLVDLLLGVIEPTSGTIRIAPNEVLGYVPQETHIARSQIEENVALEWNRANIDIDALDNAFQSASIESVRQRFNSVPNQIVTNSTLSGGERQRIGLARSLYRKPTLLVLDEATSALDAETEFSIMRHVRSLRGVATVVIVAHRLTTVQHADKVIYLEKGRVLGVGAFDDLRRSIPQLQRQIDLGTLGLDHRGSE
jgi:ABC-type multidrug transport system fused ATPase/permease subunit